MPAILGISAFYHDSAAALIVDGRIVAAAQEERFSRIKHDADFPTQAVAACLNFAGLARGDIDYVCYYEKPLLKFDRLIESFIAVAPRGLAAFAAALPVWLRRKLHLPREIVRGLGARPRRRLVFLEHHESHAASAFFPSPFDEAAILTVDGVGEWATATWGVGRGNRLELKQELRFPHSLGMLYSAFTTYCGFKVNSGEYKLMGLAPYGEPRYVETIRRNLLDLRADGSFRLKPEYFAYVGGQTMTSARFHRLFGGPPRQPESPLTEREMDLAASIQVVTEEILLDMARHVQRQTGCSRLCLAGGVALNCVANGRLLREGPFEDLWIQPAAGDAGGALGAALFTNYQLLGMPRAVEPTDAQQGSFLGPNITEASTTSALLRVGARATTFDDDAELCRHVAREIAAGKVVGWVQGRMEFGPRALGARSILGDPRHPKMQSVMNQKIKFRESFRPFAPMVLQNRVDDYFVMRPGEPSPYMLLVAPVQPRHRRPAVEPRTGLDRVHALRSDIPAVTHIDYSARIQTIDATRHPLMHRLLTEFESLTGCPVMINTSFNIRGEPIVCTAEDAYRCFLATHIDVLVIGRHVMQRDQQPALSPEQVAQYLSRFGKD